MQEILDVQNSIKGYNGDQFSTAVETWAPVVDDVFIDTHPFNVKHSKPEIRGHTTGEGAIFVYGIFKTFLGKNAYQSVPKLWETSYPIR